MNRRILSRAKSRLNLIDAIILKIITGIEAKRGKIGAQLVELHLNRVYIPRRAVYLDAIAENPELRLGILIICGVNRPFWAKIGL